MDRWWPLYYAVVLVIITILVIIPGKVESSCSSASDQAEFAAQGTMGFYSALDECSVDACQGPSGSSSSLTYNPGSYQRCLQACMHGVYQNLMYPVPYSLGCAAVTAGYANCVISGYPDPLSCQLNFLVCLNAPDPGSSLALYFASCKSVFVNSSQIALGPTPALVSGYTLPLFMIVGIVAIGVIICLACARCLFKDFVIFKSRQNSTMQQPRRSVPGLIIGNVFVASSPDAWRGAYNLKMSEDDLANLTGGAIVHSKDEGANPPPVFSAVEPAIVPVGVILELDPPPASSTTTTTTGSSPVAPPLSSPPAPAQYAAPSSPVEPATTGPIQPQQQRRGELPIAVASVDTDNVDHMV